jgi:hypothetical protein
VSAGRFWGRLIGAIGLSIKRKLLIPQTTFSGGARHPERNFRKLSGSIISL